MLLMLSTLIPDQLAQAYQSTPLGTRQRLLETTAALVHILAAVLYASLHPATNLKPSRGLNNFYVTSHFYDVLNHKTYQRFEDLPL